MKRLLILASVLFTGCAMKPSADVRVFGQVTDKTGNHRLVLNYVESPTQGTGSGAKGYDFHSLTWEAKNGETWVNRTVITSSDFQTGAQYRRWINEVQMFDPATTNAILRVGQEGPRDSAGLMHVTYTWREWNLLKNLEVRTIRVCKEPFESFENPKGGN